MAEKPIIFSTPMVQAILEGRKTQTRRVIKPQPPEDESFEGPYWFEPGIEGKDGELEPGTPIYGLSAMDGLWGIKCPYQPGDILWVRETWYYEEHMHDLTEGEPDLASGRYSHRYVYKADNRDYPVNVGVGEHGWKPSIHMPREAARIFLKVTNVRVERLQDITEEDARAEGITDGGCLNCGESEPCGCQNPQPDARDTFVYLWNKLNEKRGYGWLNNPWVWVIEFERAI